MPKRKRVQGPPSSEAEGLPEEIGRRLRELQVHQAELEAQNKELRRRQKELNAILLPGGDVGSLELADILDIPAIQRLMEDFFSLTQMGVAILDLQGKVLVATGWQDICTQFHRIHPETAKYCVQSDTWLS